MEELNRRQSRRKIDTFYPDEGPLRRELYPKHLEFFAAGIDHRERAVIAANRVGKSEGLGAYEVACHATGQYPAWWTGRRFDDPVACIAAGDTGTTTRDIVQGKLLGPWANKGTGMIPGDTITRIVPKAGVPEAADMLYVKHVSGGLSTVQFRSYDQGREAFQGTERQVTWCDEEPPLDIYTECLIRAMTVNGIVFCTFTPMMGGTDVVRDFMARTGNKYCLHLTWDDAPHLSEKDRAEYLEAIPEYMRDARTKGLPMLGSGPVFPLSEELIRCDPFPIPDWWPQLGGLDFGFTHPFAAVHMAWDRDADVVYVTKIYRAKKATPLIHSAALKPWGDYFPYAWPHDGLHHDKTSGKPLAQHYREEGLNMHFEHAQFTRNADGSPGGNGVEAGIMAMLERMQQGRLKVFSICGEWFEEFRTYHREEGIIHKDRDDLMDATRAGIMMLRIAQHKSPAPNTDRYKRKAKSLESWTTL